MKNPKEIRDMMPDEAVAYFAKWRTENPDKVEAYSYEAEMAKWDIIEAEMAAQGIELVQPILATDSPEERARKMGHNVKVAAQEVLRDRKDLK